MDAFFLLMEQNIPMIVHLKLSLGMQQHHKCQCAIAELYDFISHTTIHVWHAEVAEGR